MKVAVASDHGGFRLKQEVVALLEKSGIEYQDFGTFSEEPVDYPDLALQVAEAVQKGDFDRGIICCGTGIGVAIAANKVPGIRGGPVSRHLFRQGCEEHNDANVLTMGQRW